MRKALFLLISSLALVPDIYAALPASTVWESRTATGSDNNGGCYAAGSTGVDYSQQNTAQFSGTNLATTSTSTVVTAAVHTFVANDVGNCIHVTAGTGWTPGFYSILSVASGQATLDRAPAAASTSGGTWAEGGALANPQTAITNTTASNVIWVSGSLSETSSLLVNVAGPAHNTNTAPLNRLIGYGTSRGDSGRLSITMASGSGYAGINVTVAGWIVSNVNINCNSLASSSAIITSAGITFRNGKLFGCTANTPVLFNGSVTQVHNVEITGMSSVNAIQAGNSSGATRITHVWVHDNTLSASAIRIVGPGTIRFCVLSNNTGATADGISVSTNTLPEVSNNTVYNSGRHGINVATTVFDGGWIHNNILVGNGGYGLMASSGAGRGGDPDLDGNAYYNNALGTRNNADDTTVNPQNAGVYTNTLDVILTANPFSNANADDYTLNAVAGGGLAARGTGTPGTISSLTSQGYMDFGAFQVQGVTNVTQTACQTSGTAYAQ